MSQYSYTKKPNWIPMGVARSAYDANDIVATSKGWVYQPTGEVMVTIRGLDTANADAVGVPTFTAAVTYSGTNLMVTGDVLTVTITASEEVRASKTSYIQVVIGSTTRNATLVSGSGTTSLVFTYTVNEDDLASVGQVTVGTTIVGSVKDPVKQGSVPVTVTFTSPNTSTATAN
jgi:hypothetical protein